MADPLLHSIRSATEMLDIGRSSLYALIAEGKIRTVKIGRRTLITDQELRRVVDELVSQRSEGDEQ